MFELTASRLDQLVDDARRSTRRRINLNLHASMQAPVHRLAIAMEPDSYVRPHRHSQRWELVTVLRGAFEILVFDDDGILLSRRRLGAGEALEYPANTWHTLQALQTGSVFFEVKEGPYLAPAASDWLDGTPPEGDPQVATFMQRLARLSVGQPVAAGDDSGAR